MITNIENSTAFNIESTDAPFIMRLLRDEFYNEKLAFIRELSTNAQDAHIEAGSPTLPIEVTLPDNWFPNFKVRDFGPGLSPENMIDLYTKYGKSTKRGNKLFNGHLGIGSKSPFAYTSAFTTTSYYEGYKYTYAAFLDSDGLSRLSDPVIEATDQPNGLEIVVPVKPIDFRRVYDFAAKLYHHFTPKPYIAQTPVEYQNIVFNLKNTDNWDFEEPNFKISLNRLGYYQSDCHVLMGNVVYPVDANQFVNSKMRVLLRSVKLLLIAPPGAVVHAVNREGLQYVTKTNEWILDQLEEIQEFITDAFEQKCNSVSSTFERGLLLTFFNKNDYKDALKGSKVIEAFLNTPCPKIAGFKRVHRKRGERFMSEDVQMNYHLKDNLVFVDNKSIKRMHIQKAYDEAAKAYGLSAFNVLEVDKGTTLSFLEAEPQLKGARFVDLNDHLTVTTVKKPVDYIYRYNTAYWNAKSSDYWTPTTIDPNDTSRKVYVELKIHTPVDFENSDLKEYQGFTTIYGVRSSYIKKLDNTWIPLQQYLQERFTLQYTQNGQLARLQGKYNYQAINYFWNWLTTRLVAGTIALDDLKNPELREFMADCMIYKRDSENCEIPFSYLEYIPTGPVCAEAEWADRCQKLTNTYPFIKLMTWANITSVEAEVWFAYLNSIEGDKNEEAVI